MAASAKDGISRCDPSILLKKGMPYNHSACRSVLTSLTATMQRIRSTNVWWLLLKNAIRIFPAICKRTPAVCSATFEDWGRLSLKLSLFYFQECGGRNNSLSQKPKEQILLFSKCLLHYLCRASCSSVFAIGGRPRQPTRRNSSSCLMHMRPRYASLFLSTAQEAGVFLV